MANVILTERHGWLTSAYHMSVLLGGSTDDHVDHEHTAWNTINKDLQKICLT